MAIEVADALFAQDGVNYAAGTYLVPNSAQADLDSAARVLAELAAKRKQRGGRKSGPTKIADAASSRPRDPADRFRLARARQEELKLRRMERSVIEAEVVRRRVFAFVRLIRDRMDAAVSREAPLGAAHFKIDEGYHGSIELGLIALPLVVTSRQLPNGTGQARLPEAIDGVGASDHSG